MNSPTNTRELSPLQERVRELRSLLERVRGCRSDLFARVDWDSGEVLLKRELDAIARNLDRAEEDLEAAIEIAEGRLDR